MANVLVEIQGPGGRAKIAEKDVKSYLRRPGYSLASTPKEPKHAAKDAETVDTDETKEEIALLPEETEDAEEAVEETTEEDVKFLELLSDVATMNTPELEAVVDEHDLGVSLSRIHLVADRREAVLDALKAKKANEG